MSFYRYGKLYYNNKLRFRMPLLAVVAYGCSQDVAVDTSRPESSPKASVAVDLHDSMIADGRLAYETYCMGCHGEKGDGNGPAAGFMHPRPRNFIEARFKFSSTRAGRLPTDDDLKRTIRQGLRGTAMPDWRLLPDRTIDSLIAYIKTFSENWEKQPASHIPVVDDPYRNQENKSTAIARGEVVYHGFATCWTCHPAYISESRINEHLAAMANTPRESFRPGLFESEIKVNSAGEVTYPPDFKRDYVKGGMSVDDLYRSIAAGITGTAMPTWVDAIAYREPDGKVITRSDDIWAMAYYVQNLVRQRPVKFAANEVKARDRTQKLYFHGEIPPPVELAPQAPSGEDFEEAELFEEE